MRRGYYFSGRGRRVSSRSRSRSHNRTYLARNQRQSQQRSSSQERNQRAQHTPGRFSARSRSPQPRSDLASTKADATDPDAIFKDFRRALEAHYGPLGSPSGWQAKNSEPEVSPFRSLINQTLPKTPETQKATSTIPESLLYGWVNRNGQESSATSVFNQVLTNNSGLRNSQALGDPSGSSGLLHHSIIPPFSQVASPGIVRTNPFSSLTTQPATQATSIYSPGFTDAHTIADKPLSEFGRCKRDYLQRSLGTADRVHSQITKLRKLDFPELPTTKVLDYYRWRQQFLMQAQASGNLHVYFDKSFIPDHEKYPLPAAGDSYYENSMELTELAKMLFDALLRNHEAILSFLATVLVHALRNNAAASYLIQTSMLNPAHVFAALDEMYIQHSLMTKGMYILEF